MIVSQLDYITGYKALSSIQGSDVYDGRWSLLLCGFLGFYGRKTASELLLKYQDKESAVPALDAERLQAGPAGPGEALSY